MGRRPTLALVFMFSVLVGGARMTVIARSAGSRGHRRVIHVIPFSGIAVTAALAQFVLELIRH
ncbi:hypothetical protein K466DRAFT_607491 [Polyporus arcularius HHB13444]|uniref:Uncharacterized protein n=1 Tax=Polyporus arcularius HHB13444 TaxID=1314778 RepID=A0A5C3NJP5_9APHY|nr:hypothetical protein K466DRAFT_607491 [Polyporus arcularius HHB13444]